MLAWKWWRDCRGRAFLYWGAAVAFGFFGALESARFSAWALAWRRPDQVSLFQFLGWSWIRNNITSVAWYGAVWIGMALAISSFGRDYASPAGAFLMTRPRSRTTMIWTDWALSMALVLISVSVLVGSAVAVAMHYLPWLSNTALLFVIPAAVAAAMVVHALAMFWIVATRSAVKGIELALATMMAFLLGPGALLEWWHIAWPDQFSGWLMRIFDWTPSQTYWTYGFKKSQGYIYQNPDPYPLASLVIWFGIGLALVYASQKIVERREV